MSDPERRGEWNRRQIDDIEKKVDSVLSILNGNGKIGLSGKVDIMWGYRILFITTIITNLGSIMYFILKGG